MPFDFYQYKQGSRSTPKLRRKQPSYKYEQGNASIDSFTSLRPNSPGLINQTVPNSPTSIGSIPAWHEMDLDVARSPIKRLSFPAGLKDAIDDSGHATARRGGGREDDPGGASGSRRAVAAAASPPGRRKQHSPSGSTSQERPHDSFEIKRRSDDMAADDFDRSDAVQAVRALKLDSTEVAVIISKHETGKIQIFDYRANEISYIYGSLEALAEVYERDPPAPKKSTWRRFKSWGSRVRERLSGGKFRHYNVEVWHIKPQNRADIKKGQNGWANRYDF